MSPDDARRAAVSVGVRPANEGATEPCLASAELESTYTEASYVLGEIDTSEGVIVVTAHPDAEALHLVAHDAETCVVIATLSS